MEDSQCCVCYVLTRDFTACAHPLCSSCCLRLADPLCPLCRRDLQSCQTDVSEIFPLQERSVAQVEHRVGLLDNVARRRLRRVASEADRSRTANNRRFVRRGTGSEVMLGRPLREYALNNAEIQNILLDPLPIGPLSSRPYMRRSWLGAGLPATEALSIEILAAATRPLRPVVARRARLPRQRSPARERQRQVETSTVTASADASSPTSDAQADMHTSTGPARTSEDNFEASACQDVQPVVAEVIQKRRSAWPSLKFVDESIIADMDLQALKTQAHQLMELQGAGEQHRAFARTLAAHARHLGRASRSPEGADSVQQLLSVVRALHDSGLLGDEETSRHLRCFQERLQKLAEDDALLLRLRQPHVGISGQPWSHHIEHLDHLAMTLTAGACELQSDVCMLHQSGVLGEEEATEHLHHLSNRISDMKQPGTPLLPIRGSCHSGLSAQDVQHRAKILHRVLQSLERLVVHLCSTVRMFHSQGFFEDVEAVEHVRILNGRMCKFKELESPLLQSCHRPKRSWSLPH